MILNFYYFQDYSFLLVMVRVAILILDSDPVTCHVYPNLTLPIVPVLKIIGTLLVPFYF